MAPDEFAVTGAQTVNVTVTAAEKHELTVDGGRRVDPSAGGEVPSRSPVFGVERMDAVPRRKLPGQDRRPAR